MIDVHVENMSAEQYTVTYSMDFWERVKFLFHGKFTVTINKY